MPDLLKLVHFTKEEAEAHRGKLLLVSPGMKSPLLFFAGSTAADLVPASASSLQLHLLLTSGLADLELHCSLSFPVYGATLEQLFLSAYSRLDAGLWGTSL